MTAQIALNNFTQSCAQADTLIVAAHQRDAQGNFLFSQAHRNDIVVAAFLNTFIAWETFLEEIMSFYLTGHTTIGGTTPQRLATPPTVEHAKRMMIGVNRYFDYANCEYVKRMANLFFAGGAPFEPHITTTQSIIDDLKTMRNAAAHITSTTQKALDALAFRLLGRQSPGIKLADLLTSQLNNTTVFDDYRTQLIATATLIAT